LDPHSFITVTELERFRQELRVDPGDRLVDVGCGRRGPAVLTSWITATASVDEHRPLLSAAGFEVDAYEETRG